MSVGVAGGGVAVDCSVVVVGVVDGAAQFAFIASASGFWVPVSIPWPGKYQLG